MPVIPNESKRTGSIRVRLSPELLERLEVIAKRYGMPLSTLAAFAIARFVQGEEMNRMLIMDTVKRQADALGEQLTDDRADQLFGPMLENMMNTLQRSQLIDGGGRRDETPKTER